LIFSQKIENLVHNSAREYRCNGGYENDVMEGNDDNGFLYRFDGVPNNDNSDGGEGPDIFQSEPDA